MRGRLAVFATRLDREEQQAQRQRVWRLRRFGSLSEELAAQQGVS